MAPIPRALGGVWIGTFTCKNPDKTLEEKTYQVAVDTHTPLIQVTEVGSGKPLTRPSLVSLLTPTTVSDLPSAKWDGQKLEQVVSQNQHTGRVQVSLGKHLTMALEPDGKHARFTYDVKQISVSGGKHTDLIKTNGSGVMSRAR